MALTHPCSVGVRATGSHDDRLASPRYHNVYPGDGGLGKRVGVVERGWVFTSSGILCRLCRLVVTPWWGWVKRTFIIMSLFLLFIYVVYVVIVSA
jgi:hypothetical protein